MNPELIGLFEKRVTPNPERNPTPKVMNSSDDAARMR
jgi:hypothetical protein